MGVGCQGFAEGLDLDAVSQPVDLLMSSSRYEMTTYKLVLRLADVQRRDIYSSLGMADLML